MIFETLAPRSRGARMARARCPLNFLLSSSLRSSLESSASKVYEPLIRALFGTGGSQRAIARVKRLYQLELLEALRAGANPSTLNPDWSNPDWSDPEPLKPEPQTLNHQP